MIKITVNCEHLFSHNYIWNSGTSDTWLDKRCGLQQLCSEQDYYVGGWLCSCCGDLARFLLTLCYNVTDITWRFSFKIRYCRRYQISPKFCGGLDFFNLSSSFTLVIVFSIEWEIVLAYKLSHVAGHSQRRYLEDKWSFKKKKLHIDGLFFTYLL